MDSRARFSMLRHFPVTSALRGLPASMPQQDSNRQKRRLWRTNDPRWLRLREVVLSEEPLCRHCLEQDCNPPGPSVIVDHIDGKAAVLHDYRRENLQGLCRYHDGLKSVAENRGFGGSRSSGAPAGCDEQGVPLDPKHPWRVSLRAERNLRSTDS